jgi:hypothetical protein
MCGCALSLRPAPAAAHSIILETPAVVNGDPGSLTNTKGDAALPLETAQGLHLVAAQGMGAGGAVFDPPHGVLFGMLLFLMASGLTLIFSMMAACPPCTSGGSLARG